YRDIYTSHLGRYDLNVCSSSDPGLTGYLCANVQLDETGYFDTKDNEPDNYDATIAAVLKKCEDPNYLHSRTDYVETQLCRDEDGFVQLKRKRTPQEMQKLVLEEPERFGMYRTADGLRLIPKQDEDSKGFKILARKKPTRQRDVQQRDEDGFCVLTRTITKLSARSNKK
ncbi:MAG: hypothetical protein K2F99_01925, partial [Muribaculaceae bacterium]|nr:hypothetical protein [Muribaculaceae bacterium]